MDKRSPLRRALRVVRTPRYVLAFLIAAAIGTVVATATPGAQEDLGSVVKELRTITEELRGIVKDFRIKLPPFGFKGDEVHGQVVAFYKGVERAFLTVPDVQVYVEDVVTGTKSAPVKTDLGGTYIIPKQPAGIYRVCWRKDGWIPECMDKTFTLKNVTAFPGLIGIRPIRTGTGTAARVVQPTGIVRGHVQLADGGTCWFDQQFFGLEETAVVELVELITGTVVQRVRANDHGDFVLTKTPTNVAFQIRTRCGKEIVRTAVFPNLADLSGGTPFKITVPNNTPRIKTVFATDGSKLIRRAALGASVQVRAEGEDADGDTLVFDWRVLGGSGSLSAPVANTVTWTLPTTPGRHNLYVVVTDKRGGRHFKRMPFEVGTDKVLFGGTVVGSDGPAINGAAVTVNGKQVATDGKGAFLVSIPAADNYVLHIEAKGYVEVGRRLQSAIPGTTWVMTKAFKQVIDPFKINVIVDGRKDWIRPDPDQFRKVRPRRPSRLTIDANTLIGVDGKQPDAANGPFNAYFATIDSNTELLPGDYTAVNRQGKTGFMESFGAAFTDVRDATGRKYTLKPGASAVLEGAIQTPQLNNVIKPPAKMGLFTFDPKSGNWIEQQEEATISASGTSYEIKLSSFSTKNFDKDKPNPACLRVNVDAGILGLGDVRARVDVATGTNSVERRETELDTFDNAFYNMPINAPFTIEVFQGTPPNDVLIFADTGNTGGPWGGTGVPPGDFTVCKAEVVLTFPTTPPAFLQYSKGTGSLARAQGYYAAIDPNGLRPTLGNWWQVNGFDPVDGSGGTRTSFLNHNDLGFGRDMHCRANGTIGNIGDPITGNVDIACYVTNYGEPDQEIGNANLAQVADKDTAIATVAMEYSAVQGQDPNDRIVKFYVYQGGKAANPRVEAADLDKAGPKFVPNLCLICHGGNYTPANEANPTFDDINMGSSFREFDTFSFKYPDTNPQAAQEPDFLVQNTIAYHSKPSPAIQELVKAFYAGGSTVDPNAIPAGWFVPPVAAFAPQEEFYLKIVGKSCRTCHVAQPGYNPLASALPVGTYPDWGTYELFRDNRLLAYALVCNAKQMPNALVTFKNFWLSLGPHRPKFFETFEDAATGWTPALGTAGGPCDP